jgi:hypothetical protein
MVLMEYAWVLTWAIWDLWKGKITRIAITQMLIHSTTYNSQGLKYHLQREFCLYWMEPLFIKNFHLDSLSTKMLLTPCMQINSHLSRVAMVLEYSNWINLWWESILSKVSNLPMKPQLHFLILSNLFSPRQPWT